MRKPLILALSGALFISGCAHYISEQSRLSADRSISFALLVEDPGVYRGKFVLLGGTVATLTRTPEGSRLEVIQHHLDSRELPDEVIPSGGRFLAVTPELLDPDKYGPGTLVTMAGEVVGKQVGQLQGVAYTFPVIAVKEIHDIVFEPHPPWELLGGD